MNTQDKSMIFEALKPESTAWISANAGTGKTHILTHKLLQQIIMGTRPEKILCLTFTNAAAAEMIERISKLALKFVYMSYEEFREYMQEQYFLEADRVLYNLARDRLSHVVDFPDNIKIYTIHSFCEFILSNFSIEAGVSPFFKILDENDSARYLNESWKSIYLSGYGGGENFGGENFCGERESAEEVKKIIETLTLSSIENYFSELISNRSKIAEVCEGYGGVDKYLERLKERLFKYENCDNEVFKIANVYGRELGAVAKVLEEQGASTDLKIAKKIRNFLRTPIISNLLEVASIKKLNKKSNDILEKDCGIYFERMLVSLREVAENIKKTECFNITKSFLKLYEAILKKYSQIKTQNGYLDYDDLIEKTADLLNNKSASSWVLYKLDGGIEHILVDEAQDTNQLQWKVVDAIANEFFAGEGKVAKDRTLFVVGDEKQSIYGFQGADYKIFKDKKDFYYGLSDKKLISAELQLSRRTLPIILNVVDEIFNNENVKPSVTKDNNILHSNFRNEGLGFFEVNKIEFEKPKKNKAQKEKIDDDEKALWGLAQEINDEDSEKKILAQKIADRVKELLDSGIILESTGQKIDEKDILILVRKRKFVEMLSGELLKRGIKFAGVDKIEVNKSLLIADLISALKFCLLEDDDLNLAGLLKSPFFGISEDELQEICTERATNSVWREIKLLDKYNGIEEKLNEIRAVFADSTKPSEFYFKLCAKDGMRKKLATASGAETNDIIDEFLNYIKNFESKGTGKEGYLEFVKFLQESNAKLTRRLEGNKDALRIITVHSSKGLEAPVVILAETSFRARADGVILTDDEILIRASANLEPEECETAKEKRKKKNEDEEFRLLYVALTRARDGAIVFGNGKNGADHKWFWVVANAVKKIAQKDFDESGRLFAGEFCKKEAKAKIEIGKVGKIDFEQYVKSRNVEKEIEIMRPSQLIEKQVSFGKNEQAFEYGSAVHRLLEVLPEIKKENFERVSNRILQEFDLDDDTKKKAFDEALSSLNCKEIKKFFGENSKAEMSISGFLNNGSFLNGKIDRIYEAAGSVTGEGEGDEIHILDFKTSNFKNEAEAQNNLDKFKPQLYSYKEILEKIYPSKKVFCAVFLTKLNKLYYI